MSLCVKCGGVKAHYNDQKILSQILFFEIVQLSTSTEPILKEDCINYIQIKVVQLPNNAIVKRKKYIFTNLNNKIVYL
jgi:hypothetical protein